MGSEHILLTEEVSIADLESVTKEDMVRFAKSMGREARTISIDGREGIQIYKDCVPISHQIFFEEGVEGVIDYMTAMSKDIGNYRVDVLRGLLSIKYRPSPESCRGYPRDRRRRTLEEVMEEVGTVFKVG